MSDLDRLLGEPLPSSSDRGNDGEGNDDDDLPNKELDESLSFLPSTIDDNGNGNGERDTRFDSVEISRLRHDIELG